MGHPGKDMTCTKVGIAALKCSPPPQLLGQGLSIPGAPRVPPGPRGNHPVNHPTSSSSTPPPQPPSGAPRRHPICLQMTIFQLPAELRKTSVAGIMDLPPLLEMSNDEYDAADESDNSLDMGSAEVKPPISLKQTEYSLKKFGKGMGQAKDSVVNKWKKVWVAGFLHNKHWSMIQEQNHLNQVQD